MALPVPKVAMAMQEQRVKQQVLFMTDVALSGKYPRSRRCG